MNWICARGGVRQPSALQPSTSGHASGTWACKSWDVKRRGSASSRVPSTHPPLACDFGCLVTYGPLFLSVLPTACSRHVRSHLTLGFASRSPPKASLLPCSFSSPPPLLSCRLSLGKGGGELGEHGEEPGGGSRGRRGGFQTSTGQRWQGGSASLCLPLPLLFLHPLRTLLPCG